MKVCARTTVARDEGQRDGAVFRLARERAREIGDDEGVEAFRRAGERDGAALAEARRQGDGGVHVRGLRSAPRAGAARSSREQRRVELARASALRR